MNFISPEFAYLCLLFFPVYWLLAAYPKLQRLFLLFSGYGIYASWSIGFAVTLLSYSVVIWGLGVWISRGKGIKLAVSVVLCLGFLIAIKYYEFTRETLVEVLGFNTALPVVDLAVPVGVSFFTFQAITYLVAVSRQPEFRRPLDQVLLFLCFWPTLFAGPIFRAEPFFAQIDSRETGSPRESWRALYLILLGITQKLVLSSWLAENFVDQVFKYPENFTGIELAAAILGYTLQIFLDFSGYTLIVTGLALLLGYELPINFRQPYLARNLQDFWMRWHISLSSFIRDYIYIPLGGNRHGFSRAQANVMFSMLISGLWHGPHWTFVVWGLLHGCGVIFLNIYKLFKLPACPIWLAHGLTMLFVALTWVFFRADTMDTAWQILYGLFVNPHGFWSPTLPPILNLILFSMMFWYLSKHADALQRGAIRALSTMGPLPGAVILSVLLTVVISLGPDGVPGFIYFRF